MKNPIGAARLSGFDKPTVWTIMTPLAIKTQSCNLGQGFPSWQPPQFFRKYLDQATKNSNFQYTRAFGSLNFTKAIAEFHKKTFGQIDHQNCICVVNGGVEGLFSSILGLVNPGEEAIIFDPSYDCYRPQVQIAGGKSIGIPLKPKKLQSKEQMIKKIQNGIISDQNDQWEIDYPAVEKALNQKTKILILNNPHNPVGKVFSMAQIQKLAAILQKHPQVVVIQDNVYQGMTFDDMFQKPTPKMSMIPSMADRVLSIYSAGKIFATTGVRCGWVVGPAPLIRAVRSVHQYNVFCSNNVIQNAVCKSIEEITKPENTYMKDEALRLTKHRNLLIKTLLNSPYQFNLWIPKGGYFVLADISNIKVKEEYKLDEQGKQRTKDWAFAYQLVNDHKVVCIPASSFYDPNQKHLGEKYVRFAFCKDLQMIQQVGRRLNK